MADETVVEKVEAEVKAVEAKVEAEAKVVEAKVETFATAARVDLVAEDKLFVREIEIEFLRAKNEISRLEQVVKNAEARFAPTVQQLAKKYLINPATHTFDNLSLAFVAIEKKL